MTLIPSWAPNLHPLVIHFPIVLVIVAAAVDLADLVLTRAWLRPAATALYVAGAISIIVAYLTGVQAASTVLVPGMAYPVLTAHKQWAIATTASGLVVAVLRLVLLRGHGRQRRLVALAIGLVLVVLIQQTAERGARLVYEYGTGVIGR